MPSRFIPISSLENLSRMPLGLSVTPKELIFVKNKSSTQVLKLAHTLNLTEYLITLSSNAPKILKFKEGKECFSCILTTVVLPKESVAVEVDYTPGSIDLNAVFIKIRTNGETMLVPVKFVEKNDRSIDCEICFEMFNSDDRVPRILNACGHSLCQKCAKEMIKDKEIKCGVCREVTKVEYDVTSLLKNFEVMKLLDESNSVSVTESEKGQETEKMVQNQEEYRKCDYHPTETIKLFCRSPDCSATDEPMCYKCIDEDGKHEGHSSEPIRKYEGRLILEQYQLLMVMATEKQKRQESRIQISMAEHELLSEKIEMEAMQIRMQFDEKIHVLEILKATAQKTIDEFQLAKNRDAIRHFTNLTDESKTLNNAKDTLEKLIFEATNSTITSHSHEETWEKLKLVVENFGTSEMTFLYDQLPDELFTLTDDMELITNLSSINLSCQLTSNKFLSISSFSYHNILLLFKVIIDIL